MFVTSLVKEYFIPEKVVPVLFGVEIMLPIVFVSFYLFLNALIRC